MGLCPRKTRSHQNSALLLPVSFYGPALGSSQFLPTLGQLLLF